MTTHAAQVRAAERAVIEAAKRHERSRRPGGVLDAIHALDKATRSLLALESATCPDCKGAGNQFDARRIGRPYEDCAACHGSGRRDTEGGRA